MPPRFLPRTTSARHPRSLPHGAPVGQAQERRLAILVEGNFYPNRIKTAAGLVRYSRHRTVAFIDSKNSERHVQDVMGFGGSVPIVSGVPEALSHHPDTLVVGIATKSGRMPVEWWPILRESVASGLHVWNGLHDFLGNDPDLAALAESHGVELWDVRKPGADLRVGEGAARDANAIVVALVGVDSNVGKMTTALELRKWARAQGYNAHFVATGQTGIMIEGSGTPVDALPGDFMSGEVEKLVLSLDAKGADIIFVEGQGSLLHPGYGCETLGIILGCMPDAYVLCHDPARKRQQGLPGDCCALVSLMVDQYEHLTLQYKHPRVVGISLNTFSLSERESFEQVGALERHVGLPVADPIRHGVRGLFEPLENMIHAAPRGAAMV